MDGIVWVVRVVRKVFFNWVGVGSWVFCMGGGGGFWVVERLDIDWVWLILLRFFFWIFLIVVCKVFICCDIFWSLFNNLFFLIFCFVLGIMGGGSGVSFFLIWSIFDFSLVRSVFVREEVDWVSVGRRWEWMVCWIIFLIYIFYVSI